MTRATALYYRDPPTSSQVEEVGIAANPWGRPPINGIPHACSFRDAVDAAYADLAQHTEGWFRRARALSDASSRGQVREVTGIRMKLQRACLVRARSYLRDPSFAALASRAVFEVYVYGTPTYRRYDGLRRAIYETTPKRRKWIAKYEADPERVAAKKARREDAGVKAERRATEADPYFRYTEAERKRMRYYGVSDPKDLPQRSSRGRKPKTPIEVMRA